MSKVKSIETGRKMRKIKQESVFPPPLVPLHFQKEPVGSCLCAEELCGALTCARPLVSASWRDASGKRERSRNKISHLM